MKLCTLHSLCYVWKEGRPPSEIIKLLFGVSFCTEINISVYLKLCWGRHARWVLLGLKKSVAFWISSRVSSSASFTKQAQELDLLDKVAVVVGGKRVTGADQLTFSHDHGRVFPGICLRSWTVGCRW